MEKRKFFSRVLAAVMSIVLVIGLLPMTALAYNEEYQSATHTRFSRDTSTLAPGVTQDVCYAYSSDDKQMVYYVATADVSRDDVVVQTSYKDQYNEQQFGMAKLTEQIAYANDLYTDATDDRYISEYYNVVAGVNASFYNMTTGQPSGVCYLDGMAIGESASYNSYFAILKDGTAVIDYNKNSLEANRENIEQAVAGSQMLLYDGQDVTASISGSYNTDRASRTCVGVTGEGKVVMMVLDGRQEPFSCGGTMHELAQIMLEAGCTYAINLDGGGSTTFASKAEGQNTVSIVNRPSDGSERAISSGLIIASTAVPSDTFDHASLDVADDYVTPGTSTQITATGVSPAGTAADIPEGATYTAVGGTVDANGVFTAGAETGDAVVSMMCDGQVVGSATVHVVVPTGISFDQTEMTIPYGKTVALAVTATVNSGLNVVKMTANDVDFSFDNTAIGSVSGFNFIAAAAAENNTATVTVKVKNTEVSNTAAITLGKGSDIIADFEDGTLQGWMADYYPNYNYYFPNNEASVVTNETGLVHSGNRAMKFVADYSNSLESGYMLTGIGVEQPIYIENALSMGFWMYVPDEAIGVSVSFRPYNNANNTRLSFSAMDLGTAYTLQESGWQYFSVNLSAYPDVVLKPSKDTAKHQLLMEFYVSDRDNTANGYVGTKVAGSTSKSVNSKLTFYIDDITVDYSTAVDDREAPVFSGVLLGDKGPNSNVAMTLSNGYESALSELSLSAKVAENTTKNNYTGIDAATAKAYVDGNEVVCTYKDGTMSIADVDLADGQHSVKFSVCDKQGNYSSIVRTFTVNAGKQAAVKVVAHDPAADRILLGSLYNVDVVANNIETVNTVSVDLDLNNISVWELDHMTVAKGFTATYSIREDENIATVSIARTGKTDLTGEHALVSMPIRTWELNPTTVGTKTWTYAAFKAATETWPIDISVEIDRGCVTFTDGTAEMFTGSNIQVDTEMWGSYSQMAATAEGKAYWAAWNGGHTHTAEAIEDKAASCTENGYTGRTYCEECDSVVDWGTIIPATGHHYVDGVCTECGDKLTGIDDSGKMYVDGVLAEGWNENSYYVDGVALTGIQAVDGVYYDFGEDGISQGKYTGLFYDEAAQSYRYTKIGELASGWVMIDGDWYLFDYGTKCAVIGDYLAFGVVTYHFNAEGKLDTGVWYTTDAGTKYYYGPSYYVRGWQTINGDSYYFGNNGYRYENYQIVLGATGNTAECCEFTADGKYIGKAVNYVGLVITEGNTYYAKNGSCLSGLVYNEADGYYYYFKKSANNIAVKNITYWVSNANDTGIALGYHDFDENGRMIIEQEVLKNGIVTENGQMYYYVDGEKTYAGLINIDGSFYYVNSSCKVVTGTYWVSKANGYRYTGNQTFGTDGKMVLEVSKNGIVTENGKMYYYVEGVKTYAGLIVIDGSYYYVNSSGMVVTGTYWVSKGNGYAYTGNQTFGEDGKLVVEQTKNGIVTENGKMYYYVNGVKTYAGLIVVDGSYYYVNSSGMVVTGTYWVSKGNGYAYTGNQTFGEDGKLVIEQTKNGIVTENGKMYYYVNGVKTYAGLIVIDGSYYYVNSSCTVVTGTYWVSKGNNYPYTGSQTFAADGKLIIA